MRKFTKRTTVVAAVAAVAVAGAGAAYAAWSLNSSHATSAVAGHANPITVTNLGIDGTLLPGAPVSVKFDAANSNTFPVKITAINFSNIHTSSADCSPANLVRNPDAALPAATDLAFDASANRTITFTNALKLIPDAQSACQNATFAFNVDLVAQSNAS